MRLAIVLPCYNEVEVLRESIGRLSELLCGMIADGQISSDSFIYCVDDGSRDGTWSLIAELSAEYPGRVFGHSLAHNRGHQQALLSGLMEVKGMCDAAVSIDADLQDDPDVIPRMVSEFAAGNEIVYGVRRSRDTDSWFKRTSARGFYRLQHFMGLETVYDHADFRLMSRRALELLSEYTEVNLFLRGIVPMIGLDTATVYYDRQARLAGESKYPLRKMLAFSVDGITSFSTRPIRLIFLTGLLIMAVDLGVGTYVFGSWLSGNAVAGWSSIMLSVWFLGSLLLMAIGIVGEYVSKIYFETKRRPRYAIKTAIPPNS